MNAYLLTVLVVDFEDAGLESITELIKSCEYIMPIVTDSRSADIGVWTDEHPLNIVGRDVAPYFPEAAPEAAPEVPEVVTFESMTPGEQWHFLDEVSIHGGAVLHLASSRMRDYLSGADWAPAYRFYPGERAPGYQARYDAALKHVKEAGS